MNHLLKNGTTLEVRPITKKDADLRHPFFAELTINQEGMVHKPEELGLFHSETYDKILDFLCNHRGLWLIALCENKVVGEIDITVKDMARVKHVGQLTIGVLPEFHGRGIGSVLMKEALDWCTEQGIKRIELFVFRNNEKAIKLYEKFGFVVEGVRKNYLRHDDGTFEDDFLMAKYLGP